MALEKIGFSADTLSTVTGMAASILKAKMENQSRRSVGGTSINFEPDANNFATSAMEETIQVFATWGFDVSHFFPAHDNPPQP